MKTSSGPKVRLSCQMCHRRKIKCDKRSPCSNCSRCGFVCEVVERARLPRGRSQTSSLNRPSEQDPDLNDRIANLESIIRHLTDKADATSTSIIYNVAGTNFDSGSPESPLLGLSGRHSIDVVTTAATDLPLQSKSQGSVNNNDNEPENYIGRSFWEDLRNQVRTSQSSKIKSTQVRLLMIIMSTDIG